MRRNCSTGKGWVGEGQQREPGFVAFQAVVVTCRGVYQPANTLKELDDIRLLTLVKHF
jgi:hypothetical protein